MITKPTIELDLKEVEYSAGLGMTMDEIAEYLGVSVALLYKRKRENQDFVAAMKRGKAKAKRAIGNMLFQKAMDGDVTSAIWYEKTRYGYSEKVSLEHSMKPVHELSDDELAKIAEQ